VPSLISDPAVRHNFVALGLHDACFVIGMKSRVHEPRRLRGATT